jgi:hypothetical protein
MSILIDAPPAEVFRALVEPEALNPMDRSEGGRGSADRRPPQLRLGLRDQRASSSSCPTNASSSTGRTGGRQDAPADPRHLTLEPVGSKTRLTMVHDGFSHVADKSDYPFPGGATSSSRSGTSCRLHSG